jgi:hypothetical protein
LYTSDIQFYTSDSTPVILIMSKAILKEARKNFRLCCDYCGKKFNSSAAKSTHIKMNRCPEIKKLIATGAMEPFTRTKKPKLIHETYEPTPPVPEM